MSCMRTIYMGNSACTEVIRNASTGNNAEEKVREYRSSVYKKKTSKIHTVKWNRIHVHVTMCGVSVCHHHQIVATCTVHECCAYRFMYSTMQVCAQVHKGV